MLFPYLLVPRDYKYVTFNGATSRVMALLFHLFLFCASGGLNDTAEKDNDSLRISCDDMPP